MVWEVALAHSLIARCGAAWTFAKAGIDAALASVEPERHPLLHWFEHMYVPAQPLPRDLRSLCPSGDCLAQFPLRFPSQFSHPNLASGIKFIFKIPEGG